MCELTTGLDGTGDMGVHCRTRGVESITGLDSGLALVPALYCQRRWLEFAGATSPPDACKPATWSVARNSCFAARGVRTIVAVPRTRAREHERAGDPGPTNEPRQRPGRCERSGSGACDDTTAASVDTRGGAVRGGSVTGDDAQFPPCEQVIPKEHEKFIIVDGLRLIAAPRRAQLMSLETRGVKVEASQDGVTTPTSARSARRATARREAVCARWGSWRVNSSMSRDRGPRGHAFCDAAVTSRRARVCGTMRRGCELPVMS